MERVVEALCDATVKLNPALIITATDQPGNKLFAHQAEGLPFTNLIIPQDVESFKQLVLQVSASHVTEVMVTTLLLIHATTEATLLVSRSGDASCIVRVAIRLWEGSAASRTSSTSSPAVIPTPVRQPCHTIAARWRHAIEPVVVKGGCCKGDSSIWSSTLGVVPGLSSVVVQKPPMVPKGQCGAVIEAWPEASVYGSRAGAEDSKHRTKQVVCDGAFSGQHPRTAGQLPDGLPVGGVPGSVADAVCATRSVESSDSFTLSEDTAMGIASMPSAAARAEMGVQTEPGVQLRTCGINTLASWQDGCVVCATCSKPPRPPSAVARPAPPPGRHLRPQLSKSSAGHRKAPPAGAFDGSWVLAKDSPQHVSQWLHALHIRAPRVLDGTGNVSLLTTTNGQTFLEGGRLSLVDGVLIREGRSGRALTFIPADGQVDPVDWSKYVSEDTDTGAQMTSAASFVHGVVNAEDDLTKLTLLGSIWGSDQEHIGDQSSGVGAATQVGGPVT